ncbi:TRAP transporter solute receptor, TAXI family [Desulfitobacterium dichloroeliminans LMG P-21439]|uniref:TRAP transporter solute receptor, TAXI family n=1 Tax=Desulfitobacterium dichloroeliminans (strain LMG P-21439 / DCA1) TaxID=871963 RepID=L0FAR9_DESDL|nr:TAXI family TRAP transporter solute-binding subunit [Desulfitobacterium dichloroeliminans]AGA70110.1 TRAP transporter solute receptor, TAXI family [Desulfitobacterium dichloroeliminans LMG P-21439]
MKKFNKVVSVFVMFAMVLMLVSGCSSASKSNGGNDQAQDKEKPVAKTQLRIMSTSGGDKYFLTTGICKISDDSSLPIKVVHQTVAGDAEAVRRLKAETADIGMANVFVASMFYNGTYTFEKDGAFKDMRALFAGPSAVAQYAVRADSNIKSFEDISNKTRMATFMGASQVYTKLILDAYGKQENVDYVFISSNYADMADQIKDKTVDVIQFWSGAPCPQGENIEADVPIRLLPVNDKAMESIKKEIDPSVYPAVVKAGTYKGQAEDVTVPATPTYFIMRANTDEEVAYNVTKLVLENLAELEKIHPLAKEIDIDNPTKGLPFPLHPGAEKYLKEKGYVK